LWKHIHPFKYNIGRSGFNPYIKAGTRPPLKKLLIIFCVLIFGYIQVGYFIQSFALRIFAKRQMILSLHDAVPQAPVDRFALGDMKGEIEWEDEGSEFWFNGQLYDVVGQTTIQGKTYSYCINDLKEEEIVNAYINTIRKRSNPGQQEKSLVTIFTPIFLENEPPLVKKIGLPVQTGFHSYKESVLHRMTEIFSPPPDCSFL
jgi:hypothetical protein